MNKTSVQKTFGIAVRGRRKALGLSQKKLALRTGLHRTYVSDIERGSRNVSIQNIANLAAALETPIASLFVFADGSTSIRT